MDRPIAPRNKSDHLICGTGWALLLAVAGAYFAYLSYSSIRAHDLDWNHDWWNTLTWLVWMALAAGLASEVRCWRERILFGVLLVQFLIGCTFSLWTSAELRLVRGARQVSLILWCAATVLGVVVLVFRRNAGTSGADDSAPTA